MIRVSHTLLGFGNLSAASLINRLIVSKDGQNDYTYS